MDKVRGSESPRVAASHVAGAASGASDRYASPVQRRLKGMSYDDQLSAITPRESSAPTVQRLSDTIGAQPGSIVQRRATEEGQQSAAPGECATVPFTPACGDAQGPGGESAPATLDDQDRIDRAIAQLELALATHRELVANNHIANIGDFLTATGGDGAVAISKTALTSKLEGTTVKSTLTSFAKIGVDILAQKALGEAVGKALTAHFSLGLSLLYDLLVELIFDSSGKALRGMYRAGNAAGVSAMVSTQLGTLGSKLAAAANDQLIALELRSIARRTSSAAALQGMVEWADQQVPALVTPIVDTSLHDTLLETWLLQRAGDEDSANAQTDPEAYDKVLEKLAPSGNLARRDLFIHQCRYQLGRMGIDAEPLLSAWASRLESFPKDQAPSETIAQLGPLFVESRQFAHPERLVDYLGEQFAWDDDLTLLPTEKQQEEKRYSAEGVMNPGYVNNYLEEAKTLTPKFLKAAGSGDIALRCELALEEADGAIYVGNYKCRVWGTRHDADGNPSDQGGKTKIRIPPKSWTESP